ncbi:MAG: flavin reductase family protein [Deltaproteobacteria bacterium]|nr:flavin reductase family protein [Deltaproteobacteria bacterium]MBW2309393.1 flavin reductase family protein [Deltaproteobacteria bacterium]
MKKTRLDLMPVLFPTPVVLVTCKDPSSQPNIITIAWTGVVNSKPPMIGISIQPIRYSHKLIRASGEFGVNIPTREMLRVTDYCGSISGRRVNKFETTGLTAFQGEKIAAPLIEECPVNLECKVRHFLTLGMHDLFIGEILAVHADKDIVDDTGHIVPEKMDPVAFFSRPLEYWSLREKIGTYGFTQGKL